MSLFLQVVQQTTASADHLEKAATRMVVFAVGLEMLGEVTDTLTQNRDLHFW